MAVIEETRKIDLVVAGYIFSKDKVLLVHHKKLDLWLPVGGHLNKDETPDKALLREIKEETGLDVELIKNAMPLEGNVRENLAVPFHVNVHSVGDHDHCCLFYICKALNAEKIVINKELKNFRWFSREELHNKEVPLDVRGIGLRAFELKNEI